MTPINQQISQRDAFATRVVAPEKRGIPFDYAFRYELTGIPGTVLNSLVTISIESSFTAVSIGYGVVPLVRPIIFGIPETRSATNFSEINLDQILRGLENSLDVARRSLPGEAGPDAVFKNGFKLNPEIAEFVLESKGPLNKSILQRLFQVIGSPAESIQFKYALFDEGSGREFQSGPMLNTAGLGSATGERPFRYFVPPITFRPRSTIRMEITEASEFKGELHISLHGYKELESKSSTGAPQRMPLSRSRR